MMCRMLEVGGVKVAADKSKGEEKATVKMLLMVVTTSSGQVEVVMLGVVGGGFEECSRVSKVESVSPCSRAQTRVGCNTETVS
jgi:hypothetical protein